MEPVRISVMGGLAVARGGERALLPASRKTRALLAYLALNPRPQRREFLCELFWDLPDDPRAALRWSLSKLRAIVNDSDEERLLADRERIALRPEAIAVDLLEARAIAEDPGAPRAALESARTTLAEPLLAGADEPNNAMFQAWLVAERDAAEKLRDRIERRLAGERPRFPEANENRKLLDRQRIGFCKAKDQTTIAYATVGDGPPLVKAANWLTHLELDWDAPIWSPLFRALARRRRLIRYDERGAGLSDWDVADISMTAFVEDLESVVDAAGLDKFALLGISQGAAVSIEYAARHPERVTKLVLFGGYPAGWRINATPETIAEREAVMVLTRAGWGLDSPAYRQIFSSTFMPTATHEELDWFNEFQRRTTSAENAARFLSAFGDIDVRSRLGAVKAPTLVIHSRGDQRIPCETGRGLAADIKGAEFLSLDSENHLLLGREKASEDFVAAVDSFLGP
jgi:pimeloyl-ACP methyl ester carboxylesterase